MTTPRGIRNHNPGNLIELGIDWDGLATADQRTADQRAESKFCVFTAPWWGIRAMAKVLQRYYFHGSLQTVAGMVSKYAPGHENPTDIYTGTVAAAMGVDANKYFHLNFASLAIMVDTMINFENGAQPYTWEIPAGIIMAGKLQPLIKDVSKTAIKYG